ncbi:hypothetical protein ACFL2Q_16195 [Thermodesulfobacteriota bacterium]
MPDQDLGVIRKRLDSTVMQVTEMVQVDIYQNIIVATVQDWFEGNDSISELNNKIKQNVQERWPFLEKKVRARLSDFEEYTTTTLASSAVVKSPDLDVTAISEGVSQGISMALGALGSAFLAMICGGAGTALIVSGPVGWIIGAIVGALGYFLGKTTLEDLLSGFIVDKKIPALVKRPAKAKVAAQLKLNESRFEQDVHDMLEKQLQPVYEVLKS